MKTNYDFPYTFRDYTKLEICKVTAKSEDNNLEILVDVLSKFHPNVDVVFEIECSETFYRNLCVLSEGQNTLKFKLEDLGDVVEYNVLMLARMEGEIEIEGIIDFFERGDYIGILDSNKIALIDQTGVSGLIKISRGDSNAISYDLTADWITVRLPANTYEIFSHLHKDDNLTPFFLASIGSGCIQFALSLALKDSQYRDSKWWKTIEVLLESNGYSIDEMDEYDVPGATDIILGNCFHGLVKAMELTADSDDTSTLA
jgi:hypothetical protein